MKARVPAAGRSRVFGDRFRIEEESGSGGMGTIYRAVDLTTNYKVALKVLHKNGGPSSERFNQEAALLAELDHPAIVHYVHHGVTSAGEHFLAMEWLEGETLEDRLMQGPVRVLDAARLSRRVLDALEVAHRKGVVHRDIKPANLFLPVGELTQVKVLDFGIARKIFEPKRITVTGSTLGTPMYMSPEQARGLPNIDARSDIFSLGCVLFECLTGQPPFTGENSVAVLAKICLDVLDVRGRCRGVPAPFLALLERMLEKDTSRRPRNAADLATEFGRVIDDLVAAGYGNQQQPPPNPRTPTPVGVSDDQKVLSAILVSRPRPLTPAALPEQKRDGTWDMPSDGEGTTGEVDVFDENGFVRVKKLLEPFGAKVERFLGGSMVITLAGRGQLGEQASHAARCALRLKSALPMAALALSTARSESGKGLTLGQVVDWAARVLAGEQPGSISVEKSTADLLEARFEVKGEGQDGAKRYLLFEKGPKEGPRTLLGKTMPCVGREHELADLEALYDECMEKSAARAVLVTAPSGAGKSRLRREFLDRLQRRGEGFEYLVGRGEVSCPGTPFGLLAPGLRAVAGILGGEPPEVQQKRLFAHVSRYARPEAEDRMAAFLGEMAGIPFPDADLPELRAARQDPRLMADQMLSAWLDWLEAECRSRPVMLVLEDMHWGDTVSLRFLDAALRALGGKRFFVLALARPDVDQRFPGLWAGRGAKRMELPPLTSKACQRLVHEVLDNVTGEKAAWIVERTQGNPFFLEEILRAVQAGADLKRGIPDSPIALAGKRMDGLGPDAVRVAQAASVFGETFRVAALKAILGGDPVAIDVALDKLAADEVIFPRAAADGKTYVFRHTLLREAAYDQIGAADLKTWHLRIGEYLDEIGEREPRVLADHFDRAVDKARAAYWSGVAADKALSAGDLGAALSLVARGIECGAAGETLGVMRLVEARALYGRGELGMAEASAREAQALTSGSARLQALEQLLAALGRQERYGEAERWLAEARTADVPDDARPAWIACLVSGAEGLLQAGRNTIVEAVLGDIAPFETGLPPGLAARVESLKARLALRSGQRTRAVAGFQAALRLFESSADVRRMAEMLTAIGAALGEVGVLEEAEPRLVAALATAERLDLQSVTPSVLLSLSLVRAHLGRLDDAFATADRARGIARQQRDRRLEGSAELGLATVTHLAAKHADSAAHATAAVGLLQEVPSLLPAAVAALARALLAQGRLPEALPKAREANALADAGGRVIDDGEGEGMIRLILVECLFASGDEAGAREALRKAFHRLKEKAAAIDKPEWCAAFLKRLPDHARIMDLARQIGTPMVAA